MRIGPMRHILTIQTYADSIGGDGENSRAYSTFATAFADIQPVSGREFLAAEKQTAEITHKIVIRWIDGVLEKMRGVDGDGRIFEFQAILPDTTNRKYLQIMATEARG